MGNNVLILNFREKMEIELYFGNEVPSDPPQNNRKSNRYLTFPT